MEKTWIINFSLGMKKSPSRPRSPQGWGNHRSAVWRAGRGKATTLCLIGCRRPPARLAHTRRPALPADATVGGCPQPEVRSLPPSSV